MTRQPVILECQCRGPERRATGWHVLAALVVVTVFVVGANVLRPVALPSPSGIATTALPR